MDSNIRAAVPAHMRGLAEGVLSMANYHAHLFNRAGRGRWPEVSVVEAAHAAELFVKSRICEEHPMLIFRRPPSGLRAPTLDDLLSSTTVAYKDLPALLIATTGIHLPNAEHFLQFGALRNQIQHFLPPADVDFQGESLEFIYGVIDPFINACWGLHAIDYNEDDPPYHYLMEALVRREIPFLVSPGSAASWEYVERPDTLEPAYRREMEERVAAARTEGSNHLRP